MQIDPLSLSLYCIFFLLLSLGSIHGKRRWKQRGMATGFIAALYAEMWGLPLSLFVITSLSGGSSLPYQFDNLAYYFIQPRNVNDVAFSSPPVAFRVEYILARALTLLSIIPIVYGWFHLKKNQQNGLVRTGPYAYSRNPQYIGFVLFVVGMTLYWPTLLTVPMGIVLCVAYYKLALKEEKDLLEEFGDQYRDYAKEVPRFVGRDLFRTFRLPRGLNLTEKVVEVALLIPFILWFAEALVSWGLGMENLVNSYWMPIAYWLPVHIGVVVSSGLLIAAGLATITRRHLGRNPELTESKAPFDLLSPQSCRYSQRSENEQHQSKRIQNAEPEQVPSSA